MKKIIQNDYMRLFIHREGVVVLGKKYATLWILSVMLIFTFFAIAFSNASLSYLSKTMNDPFINWVSIQNDFGEEDIDGLLMDLSSDETQTMFNFHAFSMDYMDHYLFFSSNGQQVHYPSCLFFESFSDNQLLTAILSDDNVIGKCSVSYDDLEDETIGVIITEKQMNKMGYHKPYPAYVHMCKYSPGADELGFELYQSEFAYVPIPIIAIVDRLPMNMDIVSTKYVYAQNRNDYTYPFNLNNAKYVETLKYFVPQGLEKEFKAYLANISADTCYIGEAFLPNLKSFRPGTYISFEASGADFDVPTATAFDEQIISKFADKGVMRVFEYAFSEYEVSQGQFISVQFDNLKKVKDFGLYIEQYKVSIELSQINAKENFNAVSILAQILTWVIILFAIACVILFIVNLLQTYFQKVKRNLGTFKAFGMSNRELIKVYLFIISVIVSCAIIISLLFVTLFKVIFDLCGLLYESRYTVLQLVNWSSLAAILIIVVCSSLTVYMVMNRQLKATPGDLIYDR